MCICTMMGGLLLVKTCASIRNKPVQGPPEKATVNALVCAEQSVTPKKSHSVKCALLDLVHQTFAQWRYAGIMDPAHLAMLYLIPSI